MILRFRLCHSNSELFDPLFQNEPVPEDGLMDVSDQPGFGVELSSELVWERPEFK